MKTLVTVKRVEDPESKICVRPDGSGIVADGVNYKMNPFDEVAVEEALRLRERHGGEILVVSMGGEKSAVEIRAAMAMGADRGVLIRCESPLDPFVSSAILAKVVELETPDLCILGKQSIDDDQGQTGQSLAERLGWPQATFASKAESLESEAEQRKVPALLLSADGQAVQVTREVDGGLETLELRLPAVVTVDLRLNRPRFATLPGIMKAKKRELKEIPADSLGVDVAPKTIIRRLSEAPKRREGLRVADIHELWRRLHEEAKVL